MRHPQAAKSCSSLLSGVREWVQNGSTRAGHVSLSMLRSVLAPCAHYFFDLLFQVCEILWKLGRNESSDRALLDCKLFTVTEKIFKL